MSGLGANSDTWTGFIVARGIFPTLQIKLYLTNSYSVPELKMLQKKKQAVELITAT